MQTRFIIGGQAAAAAVLTETQQPWQKYVNSCKVCTAAEKRIQSTTKIVTGQKLLLRKLLIYSGILRNYIRVPVV